MTAKTVTRTRTGAESRTQPTMESRDGHRLRRCDRGTADRSPRRDCRDGCEQPPWLGSGRGIAVPRAVKPRALLQRLRSIYVACTDRNPDGVPRSDSTAGCRGPARKRSVYLPSAARVRVEIGARCAASGRCRGQPQQPRAHSRCGNPVPGMGRRAGRGTAIGVRERAPRYESVRGAHRLGPHGAPIRRGAAVCVPNALPKSELLIRAPADHRCCQLSASNGGSSRIGPAATTAAARARAAAGCLPSPKPDARPAHVETRMKSPRQGGGLRGRSFKFAARTFLDNVANRL